MGDTYLKPTRVPSGNIGKHKEQNGLFHNPPEYPQLGGFSSAAKGKWGSNKMTLEKGGPTAQKGRPI